MTAATSVKRIAVLGAGISGLTCALRLAEKGHMVTLIEGSDQLGGLGTFFDYEGRTFEKFYHCLLPSDGPLLALLDSLGLLDDVYWKPSSFAYADGTDIFALNTPVDLLKFKPLSLMDRIRVGITGIYGRIASAKGLDDITTAQWLSHWSGRSAFIKFWQPMLEAKFGDRYADVPALWFWTRFNREKGERKGEVKGYIKGGYKHITTTLASQLKQLDVTLRLNTRIRSVDLDEAGALLLETDAGSEFYDQCVVTLPWPVFGQVAGPRLKAASPKTDWNIDFQGVINHLIFLRRPLTKHYWLATPGLEYPFDGIVETSTLTDEADRGSRHIVYLTKYLHRDDPRFAQPETEIQNTWVAALQKLFPDLKTEDIEAQFTFRAPFVEPVYTCGFMQRRPPEVMIPGRVFLATTTQVYPVVTSWNGSVRQADRTLQSLG
mgnify:CR=1 FL=1